MKSRCTAGLSLLETLLALLLLSIVLLGVYAVLLRQRAALMIHSERLLAITQLNNLFEQLRMSENTSDRFQKKMHWRFQTHALLPSILLKDEYCHHPYCQVCIAWKNQREEEICLSALVPVLPYWNSC